MQLQVQITLSADSVSSPNGSSIAINTKVCIRLENCEESAIVACESLVSLQTLVSLKSILSTHLGLLNLLLIHLLWHHLILISNDYCGCRGDNFLFNVNYRSIGIYSCLVNCDIRVLSLQLNRTCWLNFTLTSFSAGWIAHAAKNDGNQDKQEHNSNCCDDSSGSTTLFSHLLQTSIILSQASWIILISVVSIPVIVGVHPVSEVHVILV